MSATEVRKMMKESFEMTAEWRGRKAVEYPDDERNGRAQQLLTELAADVHSITDETAEAYDAIMQSEDETFELIEREQEALRAVGFHSTWDSAQEFVDNLVQEVRSDRLLRNDNQD